jgi:virginiamycin A acetyltransferase
MILRIIKLLGYLGFSKLKGIEVGSSTYIRNPNKITFGKNCKIGSNCRILGNLTLEDDVTIFDYCDMRGSIFIEKGTNINSYCRFAGNVHGIRIGKHCAIAYYTMIVEGYHDASKPAIQRGFYNRTFGTSIKHISKGEVLIGNDVWIGARSLILSGVRIGDGAIVAAGSTVIDNVEPYSIVAGVPARRKKYRFNEKIREQLLQIKWWDWSEEKLKKNKRFFMSNLNEISDILDIIE